MGDYMEVYINVVNINSFIEELFDFLQKLKKDYQVKYSNKDMCLLYKYFYIYFMDDTELDLDCIREDYDVQINLELMINVYNKWYFEALDDIIKIINWISKKINTDIILLDEQSHLIFLNSKKELYYDKNYPNFPFEELVLLISKQ